LLDLIFVAGGFMARSASKYAAICLFLYFALLTCAEAAAKKRARSEAQEDSSPPVASMSIWQARKAVVHGLQSALDKTEFTWGAGYKFNMHPDSVRVSAETIECAADVSEWGFGTKPSPHTEACRVNLKSMGTIEVKRFRHQYELREDPKSDKGLGLLEDAPLGWETEEEAQTVADALNRLRAAARGDDLEQEPAADFRQKAAAWRALATKPAIPEEVRRHRILAENNVQEKQFADAIEEYEAGLVIDPLWPEGHFNAALLAAELGYYGEAIRHMHAYLELLPDASDAPSARDQIVIWEAKIKQARAIASASEGSSDQGPRSRSCKPNCGSR
jgi:tetratricopeptide (TPR) repeat protein